MRAMPSTPRPPAFETSTTTSRQCEKAKIGTSIPNISQRRLFMQLFTSMDESSALVISVSSAKTLTCPVVVAFAHPTKGESHERQRCPGTDSSFAPSSRTAASSSCRSLASPTPEPAADEVVLRVEATPINPSDIGLLFGAADLATLAVRGSGERHGGHRARPRRGDAGDGRPPRPVDAGRQRGRRHRGRGGQRRRRAGAARQDRRRPRRRDVLAVPLRQGRALPAAAGRHAAPPRARRASSIR